VETPPDRLPFPLLFAEPIAPPAHARRPQYDVVAELARLRPQRPTGRRDKVLIVAAGQDRHADAVAAELVAAGCPVCRLDVESFPSVTALTVGLGDHDRASLRLPAGELAAEEIRSVWFRRGIFELFGIRPPADEVANFVERESYAALIGMFSLLDGALFVNDPAALYAAESKLQQLRAAADLGFAIPRTLVTNDPGAAADFIGRCGGDVVVKAFRGQLGDTLDDTRHIPTRRVTRADVDSLALVRNAPCIFQEVVPKAADVRVTVVGRDLFAVDISPAGGYRDDTAIDVRCFDWRATRYEPVELPGAVDERCRKVVDHWKLAYAAIDLVRRPDGEHVFLELNPKGDWMWLEWATGLPMTRSIAGLLQAGGLPA
jgi:hypothetical protein